MPGAGLGRDGTFRIDAATTQPCGDHPPTDLAAVIGAPLYGIMQVTLVQRPFGVRVEDDEVRVGTRLKPRLDLSAIDLTKILLPDGGLLPDLLDILGGEKKKEKKKRRGAKRRPRSSSGNP